MSAALLAQIVAYIGLAISAKPFVQSVYEEGRKLINALFSDGLITIEVQNELHAHIEAVQAAALTGDVPPSWKLDADPE